MYILPLYIVSFLVLFVASILLKNFFVGVVAVGLVSLFVGALSLVNHKGLHQG